MNIYLLAIILTMCPTDILSNPTSRTALQTNIGSTTKHEAYFGGIRHARRKPLRNGHERGLRKRQKQRINEARRYLEKQLLVYNRTIALLGDEVERILHSSRGNPVPSDFLNHSKISDHIVNGLNRTSGSKQEGSINRTKQNQTMSEEKTFGVLEKDTEMNLSVENRSRDGGYFHESDIDNISFTEEELEVGFGNALKYLLSIISNATVHHQVGNTPCEQWADCKGTLQDVFLGPLPACPCTYPTGIFYENKIWDSAHKRNFRWKDASGEGERLDVYKPGAEYCIRSLLAHPSITLSAQHCCYDRSRKLITRGSGAGNPNFVSPDVSSTLHYKLDILPWRICKGDFTRYNKVRPPNNGNSCGENPDNEEYRIQVERTTSF